MFKKAIAAIAVAGSLLVLAPRAALADEATRPVATTEQVTTNAKHDAVARQAISDIEQRLAGDPALAKQLHTAAPDGSTPSKRRGCWPRRGGGGSRHRHCRRRRGGGAGDHPGHHHRLREGVGHDVLRHRHHHGEPRLGQVHIPLGLIGGRPPRRGPPSASPRPFSLGSLLSPPPQTSGEGEGHVDLGGHGDLVGDDVDDVLRLGGAPTETFIRAAIGANPPVSDGCRRPGSATQAMPVDPETEGGGIATSARERASTAASALTSVWTGLVGSSCHVGPSTAPPPAASSAIRSPRTTKSTTSITDVRLARHPVRTLSPLRHRVLGCTTSEVVMVGLIASWRQGNGRVDLDWRGAPPPRWRRPGRRPLPRP